MAENIIMIIGLVLSAVLLYFAIGRLFDTIDPHRPDTTTEPEDCYQIALEDIVFVRELSRFLDPHQCQFFTGSKEEIISELHNENVDLVVLHEDAREEEKDMHHMRVQYYASAMALQESGINIQLLRHQARTIEVYYKDRFSPIVQKMMEKGVIVRT